jgi:hypothetical protein
MYLKEGKNNKKRKKEKKKKEAIQTCTSPFFVFLLFCFFLQIYCSKLEGKKNFFNPFLGEKNYQIHHIERQKELLNSSYLDIAFQLVARM